jgi:putative peptidoglycan lipid II flippase
VFDQTCAGSTRAVLLMSWLGTAVIVAIAVPAAHVLAKQPDQVSQLIEGFVLFAPGVAGLAVVTNLSRVMFAIGRLKVAAAGLTGSWLLVTLADVVLAELAPPHLVVGALALGNTIGQTVVAIPMTIATRRICGKPAVHGVARAALAGLGAAAAGTVAGVLISVALPVDHKLLAFGSAVVAAGCAVVAFGVVAYFLDKGDLTVVMVRLRRLRRRAAVR